jgi:hypothetical protein
VSQPKTRAWEADSLGEGGVAIQVLMLILEAAGPMCFPRLQPPHSL